MLHPSKYWTLDDVMNSRKSNRDIIRAVEIWCSSQERISNIHGAGPNHRDLFIATNSLELEGQNL